MKQYSFFTWENLDFFLKFPLSSVEFPCVRFWNPNNATNTRTKNKIKNRNKMAACHPCSHDGRPDGEGHMRSYCYNFFSYSIFFSNRKSSSGITFLGPSTRGGDNSISAFHINIITTYHILYRNCVCVCNIMFVSVYYGIRLICLSVCKSSPSGRRQCQPVFWHETKNFLVRI